MAIVNGWVTWAQHIPGVADKIYSEPNKGEGIVLHSVVGAESESQDGIPNRFLSTEKDSSGRYTANAAASSMFVLRRSGLLIQMYPVTASTWTSGNRTANTRLWAIEMEGGYPDYNEPLTDAAVATLMRLAEEWEAYTGKKLTRQGPNKTLWEHREVWNWDAQNAGATACPSARGERFYAALVARDTAQPVQLELPWGVDALNAGMMKREALRHLASGDFALVERAYTMLKGAGLVQ